MTLYDLFNTDFVQSLRQAAPAFFGELEEVALVNSINATNGFSLKEVLMKVVVATLLVQHEIKK